MKVFIRLFLGVYILSMISLSSCFQKTEKAVQVSLETNKVSIFKETFEQLWLKDLQEENSELKSSFFQWVQTYLSGASYEATLRGVMAEEKFRLQELQGALPSKKAFEFFEEALIVFQSLQKRPRVFQSEDALPQWPILGESTYFDKAYAEFKTKNKLQKTSDSSSKKKSFVFQQSSSLTLKRILLEEWMLTFQEISKESPENLATYYSELSLWLIKNGVDFKIEERNRADLAFHKNWAFEALKNKNEELIFSEVTVKVLRGLNHHLIK